MHSAIGLRSPFCTPSFFLDGAYFPLDVGVEPLQSLVAFAQTTNLKAIEVYSQVGTIPQRFDHSSTTGCGSVVIWTK